MSAQWLLQTQRVELLGALCSSGTAEALESILDLLLSWNVLDWEDYQSVRQLGRPLGTSARQLLDLAHIKGEAVCAMLLGAVACVLPESQRAGLRLGQAVPTPSDTWPSTGAVAKLQGRRPHMVRRLRGCISAALDVLQSSGNLTACDCDEVQLPIHTPSQQARRLLDIVCSRGETASEKLLQFIQQAEESVRLHDKDKIYTEEFLQYQQKLRSSVAAQSHSLSTYGDMDSLSLDDIYTEGQLVVAPSSKEAQRPLGLEDLLGPVGMMNPEADTVVVTGEAGSGKSTLLQRLHLLWARGAALDHLLLLFPFSCRRLSAEERHVSLRELLFLHCCWPDGDQDRLFLLILQQPHRVLFTFDGLDEFRLPFSDEQRLCSPTQPAPVSTLLFSLLQGSLMKGVCKMVTARPGAVGTQLRCYVRKEVLLKGFSPAAVDYFLSKHHHDPAVAARLLDTLHANTALFGLCHVPVLCWIVSKCSPDLLGCSCHTVTVTDVYLLILQHFLRRCHGTHWERELELLVLRLGRLALDGLRSSCYVFPEAELRRCGVTEQDVSVGFLPQSPSLCSPAGRCYEFLHVTIQCFFAALFVVLGRGGSLDRSVLPGLYQPQVKQQCSLSCACVSKQAPPTPGTVPHTERPHLQIMVTFASGLLSSRHRGLLLQTCSRAGELDSKGRQVARLLSRAMRRHFRSIPPPVAGEQKSMHAMPEFLWLLRCIQEMQEEHLARAAAAGLQVEHLKLTYCGIGPVECSALAFVLQHLRSPIGLQLDYNAVGDVGVEQLLPCLHMCRALYLRNNNISDDGIRKLLERAVHCEHFQKIALFNNKLTDACMEHVGALLKAKQNFLSLRLGNNYITAAGAEQLAEGLRENRSLQYLGLWGNRIRDRGAVALAQALQGSSSLVWLSLVENGVGSLGARALAELIHNCSSLEELWLTKNCITREGVECLLQAMEKNTTMKSVWLGGNELTAEDEKELTLRDSRLTF